MTTRWRLRNARLPWSSVPGESGPVEFDPTGVIGDIGIADGSIDALGEVPDDRPTLDLEGRWLLPAFCDSHVHLVYGSVRRGMHDLGGGVLCSFLCERVAAGDSRWVLGAGWVDADYRALQADAALRNALEAEEMPPLFLWSADHHRALVSRAASDRLGVPHGALLEEAPAFAAWEQIPIDTPRLEEEFDHWLSRGVAAVTSFDRLGALRALRDRASRASLPLRVQHSIPIEELRDHVEPAKLRDELEIPSARNLRVEWAKVFLDGTLGSMTAWMNDAYCGDGAPAGERARGAPQFDASEIEEVVDTVARAGLAIAIHAIGDRAVEVAAEMILALRRRRGEMLDRIEHAECVSERALALIAEHAIPLSVQPCHLLEDWRTADRRLGADRSRSVLPLRTLKAKGVPIVLGTDAPVESDDPWVNLRAAVDRVGRGGEQPWIAEERIGWASAFRGLTCDAQHWNALPSGWGALRVGSPADLQLLETDRALDAIASIEEACPRWVLVAGETAWGEDGPTGARTDGGGS